MKMNSFRLARLLRCSLAVTVLALGLAASGCVHRIPIQQGNFLEEKDVERVTTGMTRVQVRALLGTPMIADPFHNSRWDYYYYFIAKRIGKPVRRHFVVHFDEQDKVARIERIGRGGNTGSVPSEDADPVPSPDADPGPTASVR